VFKALGVRATFRPQRPHIPIHLGVMASRTLALAGEVADGVLLNSVVAPLLIREAYEEVRRGAKRGARNLKDFSFGSYAAMAMDLHDEQSAREALNREFHENDLKRFGVGDLKTHWSRDSDGSCRSEA